MAGFSQAQMAARIAAEFQDGWLVNLGVGLPTQCSNADFGTRHVMFHAENGTIGYGTILPAGEEDICVVNGGGQHVSLMPGACVVDHLESFQIIRSGRLDATVLGAYQVSQAGDVANWKIGKVKGGSIGGAMELAACSKRVYVIMDHNTRDGAPRLLESCTLPITAPGVVALVSTNLGLFRPTGDGFVIEEIAADVSLDEVKAKTGAAIIVSPSLKSVPPAG